MRKNEDDVDWWTNRVIRVIESGSLFAENTHRGAVWVSSRVPVRTGVRKKRPKSAK